MRNVVGSWGRDHALVIACVLAVAALVTSPLAAQESELVGIDITMHEGEEIQIPTDDLSSYSQSGPVIVARSTPDGRGLIVRGVRAGETSLLLILTNGHQRRVTIHVLPSTSPSSRAGATRRALTRPFSIALG